jgi:signal transduction histidine kinase
VWLAAALAGGLVVGWLDRSATEVQGPLLVLMMVAFLAAIPRGVPAWAVAIATALGLPLAHVAGRLLGDATGASWGMLIVIVPAMIAAYVGAGTGAVMRSASALVDRRFLLGGVLLSCAVLGTGPVYATLIARGQPFAWWIATLWQLVSLVGWAIVTPMILRSWRNAGAGSEGAIVRTELRRQATIVLGIATVHAVLLPLGTRILFIPLGGASFLSAVVWAFAACLPLDALTYVALTGAAYVSDVDRRARAAATREAAARGDLAVARLAGLRAQLRPHFLFNALNTASVMASRGDGEGTRRVLAVLGDLLRYVMRGADEPETNDTGMVPLRDEIAFVERYLALEKERFPERLRVTVTVAPDVQDIEVPVLLLQPLVENAIKHGVGGRIGAGEVIVHAWRDGDLLRVSVSDDGPGPMTGPNAETTGIGLTNTRARLTVLYGTAASVTLTQREPVGAEAVVTIPVELSG